MLLFFCDLGKDRKGESSDFESDKSFWTWANKPEMVIMVIVDGDNGDGEC